LDFADAISQPNKVDLTQFKLWYSQAGTPTVTVKENYDEAKKEYALTLTQSSEPTEKQPHKKPFHIPLLIGLIDSSGKDMKPNCVDLTYNSDDQPLVHLKTQSQTFIFTGVKEKPVLSLNRQFSAPIKLVWNASQDELLHMIKFDSDAFNRREAAYKMTLQELRRLVHDARNGHQLNPRTSIIDALGHVLNDSDIDAEFKALMLMLPDEEILAQEEDVLDAAAFKKAYASMNGALVKKYHKDILSLYQKHEPAKTPGDRSMKNRLLSILVDGAYADVATLAYRQFTQATNMTDKLSALKVLCFTETPQRAQALESFYNEWKDDTVVFNKWLAVQAISHNVNTFTEVKRLAQTAPFNMESPNNVYSLLSLLGNNHFVMSDASGETYRWFCDQILKIDAKNPQVAARLCNSFTFVKKLPTEYREKAQTEISRVLASTELSRNSRELLQGCV
jgi:aminopeptidase N